MCNWEKALASSEVVLAGNGKNIRALLVKAEALFNLCQFEHSMVYFYRGLVSDNDNVAKKCKLNKTFQSRTQQI
jgi:hypothetical protein